jgi:hypothetical protein
MASAAENNELTDAFTEKIEELLADHSREICETISDRICSSSNQIAECGDIELLLQVCFTVFNTAPCL